MLKREKRNEKKENENRKLKDGNNTYENAITEKTLKLKSLK